MKYFAPLVYVHTRRISIQDHFSRLEMFVRGQFSPRRVHIILPIILASGVIFAIGTALQLVGHISALYVGRVLTGVGVGYNPVGLLATGVYGHSSHLHALDRRSSRPTPSPPRPRNWRRNRHVLPGHLHPTQPLIRPHPTQRQRIAHRRRHGLHLRDLLRVLVEWHPVDLRGGGSPNARADRWHDLFGVHAVAGAAYYRVLVAVYDCWD